MPRARPRGALERSAAADLFKHTLSRIPTLYGQLTYIASLRDATSGAYRHHGMFLTFGREEAVIALRESHEFLFAKWLELTLEEKTDDLEAYLRSLEDPEADVIRHWKQSRIYRTYIPQKASPADTEHFVSELEALLKLKN